MAVLADAEIGVRLCEVYLSKVLGTLGYERTEQQTLCVGGGFGGAVMVVLASPVPDGDGDACPHAEAAPDAFAESVDQTGVATRSDLLTVDVKLNEAKIMLDLSDTTSQ